MHCLRNRSIQHPQCCSFLILPRSRQYSTLLQSLLLDPLELDLWRLPERPDFFRRPPRRPPLRMPLLELELELDDLELEEDNRLRRLRWSLCELPPPRDSSDDEASLLRRRPRPPLVRRLFPSDDDDDDDDEDDRRWRRCDDDRFRALLRLRERERDDDGESFLPRRDVSFGALVSRELLDAVMEVVVEGCLLTVRSALPTASSLAWFARSDLDDIEDPEDGFAAGGPLPAWSAFLSDSLVATGGLDADDDCDNDCDVWLCCFDSAAFDEEGAFHLLEEGGVGATPDVLDELMLLHLTCVRGTELAVLRPEDISSGSTPGGSGSVGSSSCARGSLERRTADAASSTAASTAPRAGGGFSSNLRCGRDDVADPA